MIRPLLVFGVVIAAISYAVPKFAGTDCDIPARQYAAAPDGEFNALWARRDGSGMNGITRGWTGGDGGFSIPLPGGRSVWTFGDTFLGDVDESDTRVRDQFVMIRNSVVIPDGAHFMTLHKTKADGTPDSFFAPDAPDSWYWPLDGLVTGDKLVLLWQRFTSQGGDAWDLQAQETVAQMLTLPDLTQESIVPFDQGTIGGTIHWGAEFLPTGDYVYVYGIEDLQAVKQAYVARFPADGDLFGAWEYFDGGGWSADHSAAAPVADVSNSLGVFADDGHFVLISFSPGPFSNRLMVYEACDPAGPWDNGTVVYEAPESGDKRIVYFPLAHPQFNDESGWLLSYSVNTHNFDGQCEGLFACHLEPGGAANYRPRFVRVTPVE